MLRPLMVWFYNTSVDWSIVCREMLLSRKGLKQSLTYIYLIAQMQEKNTDQLMYIFKRKFFSNLYSSSHFGSHSFSCWNLSLLYLSLNLQVSILITKDVKETKNLCLRQLNHNKYNVSFLT